MNGNWNLNNLYSSFESPEFKADMDLFNKKINNYKSFVSSITNDRFDLKEKLKKYINETNNFKALSNKLIMYSNLVMSVNTKNVVAIKTLNINK